MVNKYNIQADNIIEFMLKYTGKLPEKYMRGLIGNDDFEYVIKDFYKMSNVEWKKLIVKLKNDKIIHIQKYIREAYGTYYIYWLDNKKLLNEYNIYVNPNNENNIRTKIISNSLFDSLMNFAENVQTDEKHLWKSACNSIYKKAVNDKHDRHFTINTKGKMTYTPKGRITSINEDRERWLANNKYRSEIKFGKGLRKMFQHQSIKMPDYIIEYFTNKLKGMYTFQGNIKIINGEDIRKWYEGCTYGNNTESLGNSCMRHSTCQNYFDIYTENDDKVKMIIATNSDERLIGRAILWETDSHGLFCDRIYGNATTIEAIKSYAKKQGAYTKYEQSYSSAKLVSSTGEATNDEIIITLNKGGFDSYPYMDTLKYTDDISNSDELKLSSTSGNYCLESTDGGPNDHYVTIAGGDRIHEDEAQYVERYGEWYHEEDCVYSDYHAEYIIYDRSIAINNNNDYAWEDCEEFKFVEEENQYYYYGDVVWSEYSSEYLREYDECVIHGIISTNESHVIEVGGNEYLCHNSISLDDLVDAEIISEDEYQNAENNG